MSHRLFSAVFRFDTAEIDKLLANDVNINSLEYDKHILHDPIENGRYDIVKFLIERGADVNSRAFQNTNGD